MGYLVYVGGSPFDAMVSALDLSSNGDRLVAYASDVDEAFP